MTTTTKRMLSVVVLAAMVAAVWAQPAAGAQAGKSPVKVFILAGQSNMEGQGVVDLDDEKNYNGGKGNLEYVMRHSSKAHLYKHLKDKDGKWVVRGDVWISFMTAGAGLKTGGIGIGYAGYGGKHHIGPELQFGHVIGEALDNQVLLIKTAWGGKSLQKDFRPPSSGGKVGPYYTKMLAEVREALADIKKHFDDYDGKGYEIAGFVWMQGWNDMCTPSAIPEYEQNLANLINDVRKELKSPDLPVVIGELGNGGPNAKGNMAAFRKAQAAAAQRAEFKGTVKFVKTAEFARPAKESPNVGHGHHWFGNAESYFLIGDGLGKAMVELLKGGPSAGAGGARSFFNGKDLKDWTTKKRGKTESLWSVGTPKLDPKDPRRLVVEPGGKAMVNTPAGHGKSLDIYSGLKHGDGIIELELMVPKGSNSGVYVQGEYEVQVLDSYGRKKLGMGDMGAIYGAKPPMANSCRKPGEWQKLEIHFRAPKFDGHGKKTANARIDKMLFNGVQIQQKIELKGPTPGGVNGREKPVGPLMFQGNHGPVAFRNITIRPLK